MAIRTLKPNTAARRNMSVADFSELTKKKPEKSLTRPITRKSGRNNQGRITTRHRGGGAKRAYRIIDFKFAAAKNAEIIALEYDPNRTANIALVKLEDGSKAYVLATNNMKVGKKINSGSEAEIKPGNRLKLKDIPVGSVICNIEMQPGRGGQLARSAGARAQLAAREGDWAQIKLPSGEVRLIHVECMATVGQIGNADHQNITIGSAGRKRHMGRRPSVRGKAMNPSDHPMGGGEGLSGPGRIPRTPWGKVAMGLKTRRRKSTSAMIIRGRGKGRK
ncbi:MAG: 50S ribosomal protein L2 [Candidatus Saccharibacteria bacterium]|jgi:large subunit ribosomal protein L2|nr:50S ribosomal protein L2 [Patescibacteria group bacterium]